MVINVKFEYAKNQVNINMIGNIEDNYNFSFLEETSSNFSKYLELDLVPKKRIFM